MKKFTIINLLLIFALFVNAQTGWIKNNQEKSINPQIEVIETTPDGLVVKLSLNAYRLYEVETPRGTAFVVQSPNCPNSYYKGAPDLPFITSSIAIPNQGGFNYEVISAQFEAINNIDIAPSKGSILRTVDPKTVPYEYGATYQMDDFFPFNNVQMSEPFILRDIRGSNITFFPFVYNAISKELRVYSEIIIKIKFNQSNSVNEINNPKSTKTDEYTNVYNRAFINYSSSAKYTPLEEETPGNILIICADEYAGAMADYITWKHEKGIQTELVLMSDIGTTSNQVKAYIQNYYDNPGVSYVLLIGDADKVPTIKISNNDSDNGYVYLAGNDSYADSFIGRFSANSVADIQTQVARTITYEKELTTTDTWLENAFGSASNETGNSDVSDAEHLNLIKTKFENYGYTVTHVNQDGGSNEQISTALNNGVGIANYIGHGNNDLWGNTTFKNTHVNALTNENKLPFIWSVACLNGNFKTNTCFAEAWLRATNNNNPTGAVAFLGSTINQAWSEPMTGQNEMVNILIETYPSNIKRTMGGVSFNGMFKMIEEGGEGQETADTWTLFGDPSLMVRTKTPQEMVISHLTTLSVGQTEFMVNCNVDNAFVSLTKLDEDKTVIVGSAYVSDGSANVTITPFAAPGNMKVTVTAFNKVTYQEDVLIIVPDGPYVVANGYTINDTEANNNGLADYNETIKINQSLLNVGVEIANQVTVVASTENTNTTITDNNADFENIGVDENKTINDAFTIEIANGIADQEVIMMNLTLSDNADNVWESSYPIIANAPKMELTFVEIDDTDTGNSNYTLDAGETANIVIQVQNIGHTISETGDVTISTANEYASIQTSSVNIDAQDINAPIEIEFTVEISETTPTGTNICFNFELTTGMYSAILTSCLPAGLQIEDWESGTLTTYAWENSATSPWTIVTDVVYEGTNALKSGLPADGGESVLIINLHVLNEDNIDFYKKVSCNAGFWTFSDNLSFSIDGSMKDQWTGEVAWSSESYPVSAGQHALKWAYKKGAWAPAGSDCAWLDNIKLPAHSSAITIINETAQINANSIEVYPNPAIDIAYVNVNLKENTKANVKVMNLSGQVVYEYSDIFNLYKGKNSIILNTANFTNGLYIVQVVTSDNTYHQNLIINK